MTEDWMKRAISDINEFIREYGGISDDEIKDFIERHYRAATPTDWPNTPEARQLLAQIETTVLNFKYGQGPAICLSRISQLLRDFTLEGAATKAEACPRVDINGSSDN
jgi:hypothetical protein